MTSLSVIHGTRSGCHATEVSQGVVNWSLASMPLIPRTRSVVVCSSQLATRSSALRPSSIPYPSAMVASTSAAEVNNGTVFPK